MAIPTSPEPGQDPRHFAKPATPNVQTENTVDAATDAQGQAEAIRLAHKDERAKRREAPKSNPAHDTSELPEPDVDDDSPQGEKLEAIEASVSPETEARIDRELHRVEDSGVVAPRSVIAPAKPAREPNEDEQRMAEDFDPPPLAHRTELGR